jgi:hypothetical protein
MDTPGSSPEASPPRRSALKLVLTLLLLAFGLAFVGMIAYIGVLFTRLQAERDRAQGEVDRLMGILKRAPRPAPPAAPAGGDFASRVAELEARLSRLEASPGTASSSPSRAPDLRVLPPADGPSAPRLRELESRSYACLLVSSLAQGDHGMAIAFLARAMLADGAWFRRTDPREFLGTAAFRRCVEALEARVRANPMDAAAKVLLAYLYFHEKGAEHARALLVEASTVSPDNVEAKAFLAELDR